MTLYRICLPANFFSQMDFVFGQITATASKGICEVTTGALSSVKEGDRG